MCTTKHARECYNSHAPEVPQTGQIKCPPSGTDRGTFARLKTTQKERKWRRPPYSRNLGPLNGEPRKSDTKVYAAWLHFSKVHKKAKLISGARSLKSSCPCVGRETSGALVRLSTRPRCLCAHVTTQDTAGNASSAQTTPLRSLSCWRGPPHFGPPLCSQGAGDLCFSSASPPTTFRGSGGGHRTWSLYPQAWHETTAQRYVTR